MRNVELSDEENLAILAETVVESLEALGDRGRKVAVLKRICELLESSAPQHYVYESLAGCEKLQVIRVVDDRRNFCRLALGIPETEPQYNFCLSSTSIATTTGASGSGGSTRQPRRDWLKLAAFPTWVPRRTTSIQWTPTAPRVFETESTASSGEETRRSRSQTAHTG